MLDSVQEKILFAFLPYVSLPELEELYCNLRLY